MVRPDHTNAFKMQYLMLEFTGAWPKENTTIWYRVRGPLLFSFTLLLGITMFIKAFKDITDFAKLSEILYIMVLVTTYNIKHIVFLKKRDTFIYMMKKLKDPILSSYPDHLDSLMMRRINIARYITGFYGSLVFVCASLMALSPFLDNRPVPFPFSYELGKFRCPMWIFQAVAEMIVGWNNPCLDSLAASLMSIAASQLDIIGHKIMQIKNGKRNEGIMVSKRPNMRVESALKQCIKHHLVIIELIECIDDTFSLCILTQFLGSVIIVCNTLFHFVLVKIGSTQFLVLSNYLLAVLSQLFIYCWFGTEVIWTSTKVGEACYFSKWYNFEKGIGKYLFIIMERSKRPLRITVFKFSVLSLNSFTTIMQWSYSYFALLFKLYSQRLN